jgi:DNA-directed RNA polymerase subunit H
VSRFLGDVELAVKISTHFLVPKHEILPKDSLTELFAKLRIKDGGQLPMISKADPAIKKLKAQREDVIRISRESTTAGSYTYYRVVK